MAKSNKTSGADEGKSGKKESAYKCPVTKRQIKEKTKPLVGNINGQTIVIDTKEFKTGTLGWFLMDKMTILIDNVPCKVQCNFQMYIVKSDEADDE